MESKTENGLFLIIFGSILSIFSTLGTIVFSSDNSSACLISIFTFLSFLILVIGLIMMFLGRREFGEEHRQFVIYAFIAFIIGLFIIVVGVAIMVAGALSGIDPATGTQEPEIDHSQQVRGMTTGLIVIQFGGLVILFGDIFLVFKLENQLGRNLLYLALIVGIITTIIATILISSALNEFVEKLEYTPEQDLEEEVVIFQNDLNKINLINLVGSILLLIAYYIPYDRIKKEELKPVVLPSPVYGTPMYPPQYPLPPYPPQYPYPPPPPWLYPNRVDTQPKAPVPPSKEKMQLIKIRKCPHCRFYYPKESEVCPVCGKQSFEKNIE